MKYDSPDFAGAFPGYPDGFDQRSGTAPGSEGIRAEDTAGGLVGIAQIPDGDSYQSGMVGRKQVEVTAGDSSSMSDDLPAHSSEIVAASEDFLLNTGAGRGHTFTNQHGRYPWQAQANGG